MLPIKSTPVNCTLWSPKTFDALEVKQFLHGLLYVEKNTEGIKKDRNLVIQILDSCTISSGPG